MSEIERYDCEEDRSCEYEVKAVMQVDSNGYYVRHADHLVYLNEMRMDRDAQRLRADTAEAERDGAMAANAVLREEVRTERHRADAAVGDANEAERRLAAAEQRIADLISEVAARDAALEDIGCPFEGVSDLFNDYAKGCKRYQWLRAHLSVDDFPKPHPEWSQPSEVESCRIDDLVDAALNPNPEVKSHEAD